jgi:hypothetical protein
MIDIEIKEKDTKKGDYTYFHNLIRIIMVGFTISCIFFIGVVIGNFGNENDFLDLHKSITFHSLKQHYIKNELEMFNSFNDLGIDISNEDIFTFHNHLSKNFIYERGSYDCKYWSLVWSLYAIKHNLKFQYILLEEHIFVIIEFDNMYCIADNDILNCLSLGV